MLKAIIWANTLHILGGSTTITVEATRIVIESGDGSIYLTYSDYPPLLDRIEKDSIFAKLLPSIVLQTFVGFLNQEQMAVLNLAGSMVNTKIEEEMIGNPINNGAAVAGDNAI